MSIISRRSCGIILRSLSSSRKTMPKLKTLLGLTVARLAILNNQRKARCSHARNDLLQLLQLNQQERALLRAELVIREQNLVDVFGMIEGYCHLLRERSVLLERKRVCPEELREAVSSLVFASSRIGDLPELRHVRNVFTSMFGKEFVNAAVEIRNCCGVNSKMVQKLSIRQPSLESRMRVTKEIAAEKGITLDLICDESANAKLGPSSNQNTSNFPVRSTYKYKDVVSAAQAAYESAEDAVVAAKAAVELSVLSHSRSDIGPRKEQKTNLDIGSDSEEEDVVEYFSDLRVFSDKDRDESPKEEEKKNLDSYSESEEEDSIEYFTDLRLYSEKDRDAGFTRAPSHEEEDTFELALLKNSGQDAQLGEKSESESEKHAQRTNSASKTTENVNSSLDLESDEMSLLGSTKSDDLRASYSSAVSFESGIGREDSANILPKVPRKAISMRTRRGLQR